MPSMFSGGGGLLVYTDFIATYWSGWIVFALSYVGGYFVKLRSCGQRFYFGIYFFLPFRKISIYVWTRPETHISRQEHDSLKHISTQACRGLHTNTHTLADTHLRKRATCVTSTHPQLPLRTRLLTWRKLCLHAYFCPWITQYDVTQDGSQNRFLQAWTSRLTQPPKTFSIQYAWVTELPSFCFDKWLSMYVQRGLREHNAILE